MKEFHKSIFFTKVPINGFYRHHDEFQIYPANFHCMPKSGFQEHFPNVIEYYTTEQDEPKIKDNFDEEYVNLNMLYERTGMKLKKEDKILALLSTFSNNLFFRYSSSEGSWGIPMLFDEITDEVNDWPSKWCMPLFHFPELPKQLKINEFTQLNIPKIQQIDHANYYANEPNFDFNRNKSIMMPSSIDTLFDNYFSLDPILKSIVDSSCAFNFSAMKLKNEFKTLSLISSFTAMETMISLEFKDYSINNCDCCGQKKFNIAKKFRAFLLRYIGDSETNKRKFNAYYSLRSKIIHTGKHLNIERLFTDLPRTEKYSEEINRFEILQLGKLSVINWLLLKKSLDHLKGEITLH